MTEAARCPEPIAFVRFWPEPSGGSSVDLVCEAHGEDVRRIAEALGWPEGLALEVLPPEALVAFEALGVGCACFPGHVQTIEIEAAE